MARKKQVKAHLEYLSAWEDAMRFGLMGRRPHSESVWQWLLHILEKLGRKTAKAGNIRLIFFGLFTLLIEVRWGDVMRLIVRFQILALTVSLVSTSVYAAEPVNTINKGRIMNGGTFYNTADSKTTFTNTQGGGLWLKSVSNIRGLEVNSQGQQTNNGGTLQFYAPGDVVRLDGNINVNAVQNGQGAYLGNGGRVFVDSAYLYQNGNIFANGVNGGLVQFNVAGAALGFNGSANIEARGMGGNGGVVSINASGPVAIANAVIDTSGKVAGTFDTNLINIEGGLILQEGVLRANGVDPSFGGSRGGTIRLVATGQSGYPTIQDALNKASQGTNPILTVAERQDLAINTQSFIQNLDGSVQIDGSGPVSGKVSASGTRGLVETNNDYSQDSALRAGDGGSILISAKNWVAIATSIYANGAVGTRLSDGTPVAGGNGGTIAVSAGTAASLSGYPGTPSGYADVQANGGRGGWTLGTSNTKAADSGDGGLIAVNTRLLTWGGGNTSVMANGALGGDGARPSRGGNGGLIVYNAEWMSGPPSNILQANGGQGGNSTGWALGGMAGTVVSPNPSLLQERGATQYGALNGQFYNKPVTAVAQINELLSHGENLILFTRSGGSETVDQNLFTRMLASQYRSVEDPTGPLGLARTEIITKNTPGSGFEYRNFQIASARDFQALDLTHPWHRGGFPDESATLVLPSPLSQGQAFTALNTLTINNNGSVITSLMEGQGAYNPPSPTNFTNWLLGLNHPNMGGTRISVFANGDFRNTNMFGTAGTLSGGSINIAAVNNLQNGNYEQGTLGTNLTGAALHGGAVTLKSGQDLVANSTGLATQVSSIHSSGQLMGGVQRYSVKRDFINRPNIGNIGGANIISNGGLQGGIIDAKVTRNAIIQSDIQANGTSPLGRGGYVRFIAGQSIQWKNEAQQSYLHADGNQANGTVIALP